MGQFSMETIPLPGSLLRGNQQTCQSILLKNPVFGTDRQDFPPYRAANFYGRGRRPNWPLATHMPSLLLSWTISPDFLVRWAFIPKTQRLNFGVFQQNRPMTDTHGSVPRYSCTSRHFSAYLPAKDDPKADFDLLSAKWRCFEDVDHRMCMTKEQHVPRVLDRMQHNPIRVGDSHSPHAADRRNRVMFTRD